MQSSINSSHQITNDFLAPESVRRILTHLANLPDDDGPAVEHFRRHYWKFFRPEIPRQAVYNWALQVAEDLVTDYSEDDLYWHYWLLPLRNALRFIWVSRDLRFRQWAVFRILERYFLLNDTAAGFDPILAAPEKLLGTLAPPTPCEAALMLLVRDAGLTRVCANLTCEAKYFWAEKKSQKYCSGPCARPAQRESKREWWAAHGEEWRRQRRLSKD